MATTGIYPCLTYRDVRSALVWLQTAFGIHGHPLADSGARDEDPVDHALLPIGRGAVLVESERSGELHGAHAGQGWIYVTVADADDHWQKAKSAGAQVLSEPHDFGGAFRGYSVSDLEGNLWTFGTADPCHDLTGTHRL